MVENSIYKSVVDGFSHDFPIEISVSFGDVPVFSCGPRRRVSESQGLQQASENYDYLWLIGYIGYIWLYIYTLW